LKNILHKRAFQNPDKLNNGDGMSFSTFLRRYYLELLSTIILAIILAFLFPQGKSFQFADIREGSVFPGPEIISPFTFAINKSPDEYAADLKKAKESVAPVFEKSEIIPSTQEQALRTFLNRLYELLKDPKSERAPVEELFRTSGIVIAQDNIDFLLPSVQDSPNVADRNRSANGNLVNRRATELKSVGITITAMLKELYSAGILSVEKSSFSPSLSKISIRQNGQEMIEDINFYRGIAETRDTLLEKLRNKPGLEDQWIKIAYQIAAPFLIPDVIFLREETDVRIDEAIRSVPLAKGQVLAGERIIDAHERVTKYHVEKLSSLAAAKAEYGETAGFWSKAKPEVGKFLISISILSFLIIFLWRERKDIINSRKQLLLIALIILLIALLTYLANQLEISAFLIPVAIGAMIITIFFDSYVGFLSAISLSLLVGAMRGNEYTTAFVSLFVNSVAIITVSRVRKRNWVLRSMVAIVCAYVFAVTVQDLLTYTPFRSMLKDWGYGLITGFLTPTIAYGLIIILEFVFDLTTDMTLLELSDLNLPLLRQLAMEAPGTYHHSIVVGNLAEAAAEAVGGNPLLARVGAYYHDIGKIEKPEYFVENQTRGRNPQEKLTPTMSSLILLNHVRKGAEMARHYSLPKEIVAFIYEHHGTSLMSFFYQKAVEQSDGEEISQNEFRYPGPRPKSRETAIVMLADAIEAASRTLKDPSPSRIKGVVEQLIDERFKSGELDESPLTLQDLSKIAEAFQKILIGIFHARIEYPVGKEKEKSLQRREESA